MCGGVVLCCSVDKPTYRRHNRLYMGGKDGQRPGDSAAARSVRAEKGGWRGTCGGEVADGLTHTDGPIDAPGSSHAAEMSSHL